MSTTAPGQDALPMAVTDNGPTPEAAKGYRRRRSGSNVKSAALASGIPIAYAWLFAVCMSGIAVFYCLVNPYQKTPELLALSTLVYSLASLPMALFLFRGRRYQVPAFEAHCLFLAFCFGFAGYVPIPESSNQVLGIKESDLVKAELCALLGVTALLLGYYVIGTRLVRHVRRFGIRRTMEVGRIEWLAWGACLTGIAFQLAGKKLGLSVLSQFVGMGFTLGFFGLLVLGFQGGLSFLSLCCLVGGLLPWFLVYRSGLNAGQLAGVVTLTCWMGLIILRAKGHVPVPLFLGAIAFFLALQPVKFYVRELAWKEGLDLGPVQTIQAYRDGFLDYYGSVRAFWQKSGTTFQDSFTRVNHLSTTAAIIRDTPDREPFIRGASYYPLLIKFIPRVIWPNKPEERFGNDWARRYGYLNENDFDTSFNLAWLPEMYMNFGWGGVAAIMLLVGVLFRFLWRWLMENPVSALHYIIAICLAQSLVFTESNMSLMLGGVFVFIIFLWLLGLLLSALGLYVQQPAAAAGQSVALPSRANL
jgi:hypothetical protein